MKDYIHPDQEKTFASLVNAGLIDTAKPDDSKILTFISRKPDKPNLITNKIRQQEYDAFRAWVRAAVDDPKLLASKSADRIGPSVPDEVIRHARNDRVLTSFIDNIWSEVGRCSGCHSPDLNQKQVEEHGEQVSWIKLRDPQATMDYMIEADLIDTETPEDSLLLLKPTMQVDHGGGQKMIIGDRTYRQFRRFIDDYAAMRAGEYKSQDDLPEQGDEVSVATSMQSGIWLKLVGVPARYDKKLLQVDLYRRQGQGWSAKRWATADRGVYGKGQLWQQTLSLTAVRDSTRADEIRRTNSLPPGEYLAKIYIDVKGKLAKDSTTGLGEEEFVGQVAVTSRWPKGYGGMTVVRFPQGDHQSHGRHGSQADQHTKHIAVGDKVPDFEVTIEGKKWRFTELQKNAALTKDGTLVLTFWCSFCDSCRHIEHRLDELAKQHKGKAGVIALDASAGETAEDVADFAKQQGLALPIALNSSGTAADIFGTRVTTTTVVIDSKGVLRYCGQFGDKQHSFAEDALKAVLAGEEVRVKKTKQKG